MKPIKKYLLINHFGQKLFNQRKKLHQKKAKDRK